MGLILVRDIYGLKELSERFLLPFLQAWLHPATRRLLSPQGGDGVCLVARQRRSGYCQGDGCLVKVDAGKPSLGTNPLA